MLHTTPLPGQVLVMEGRLTKAEAESRLRPSPKLTGRAAVRFSDLLGLTFNRQEPL
jgi:hypothetical protein